MNTISRSSAANEFRRRVADAMAPLNRVWSALGNQLPRIKLRHKPSHASVDDELRHHEERQRDEKPRVYLRVEQKGDIGVSPPRSTLPDREQQQG